jgi:hypothetical protein
VHDVVRRANHQLSLVVLRRSVRTRHAELNTPREKEGARGVVIELVPVVTLNGLDGEAELSGHPGKEVEEGGESLKLGTKRKGPRVVGKIINYYEIVLIARKARNRRSPQITVNKIKDVCRTRRRRRKRKANMATQLARMVKMLTRSPSARKVCTTAKLSQHITTGMTEPTVPGRGSGNRGESRRRRRSQRWDSGSRKAKGVKGVSSCHSGGANTQKRNPSQ